MFYKTVFILALVNVVSLHGISQSAVEQSSTKKMLIQDVYPIFISKNLEITVDFYTKWFDMQVAFESGFFILLVSEGERPCSIGFLSEKHPSSPPSGPPMNKNAGVFLTLQVEDAEAEYDRLKNAGLKMNYDLRDEPWGQRRFGVIDPNGMYVDVLQQTEPQKGFWEKYPVKGK